MELTARQLTEIAGGRVVAGEPNARATSFAIDSRVLEPGGCFVALVAARDGHDYVADAFARGASIALVTNDDAHEPTPGGAVVRVDDAFGALARIGRLARDALGDATVVGITGSAGKTGTKDLTAAALAPKFALHASPGSYNNEAGVPLTLLAAPPATEALVLEMGARARGDIAALCEIARPTVGVITNIGLAHAGPLGGPEGIARAKGELLEALDQRALAVLDAGDAATSELLTRTAARVVLVSVGEARGDVRASAVILDTELRPRFRIQSPWGSGVVELEVRGAHQVVNASLAAAVALSAGVSFDDVVAGLARVRPAPWRLEVERGPTGVVVLDDSYNANPASMAAALDALARVDVPGRRLAVLGEMLELGDLSEPEHAALGDLVGAAAVDALVAVGPEAAPLAAHARAAGVAVTEVPDAASALDAIADFAHRGDAVLVKGSRAVGLELVATALRGDGSAPVIALLVGMGAAFVICILSTPTLIRVLKAKGIGQQIRDDGPFAHPHETKAGTPTMGGIAIVVSAFIGYLVAHVSTEQTKFAPAGITLMALIVGMAAVGFIDDYLGVRRGRNMGLRKRGKTGGQLLVAVGFALLALQWVNVSTHWSFTRMLDLKMASGLWFVVAVLFIYGFSNAVNLTDGADGLAAGSAAMVFAAFVIIAFWQFRHPGVYHVLPAGALDLAIVSAAMMGACLGFLWWNAAPAQVFMGDVGSLALGAAMAGLALLTNTILLLPILGGLYVFETLSVIAQVISFRCFHRRVLRMAPIHHHFEVGGWPEFTVIVRFWLLAGLLVALGLGFFYADFIRIPGVLD